MYFSQWTNIQGFKFILHYDSLNYGISDTVGALHVNSL